LVYPKGTKIAITKINEKDYFWDDGGFKNLSGLINGKEGIIQSYNEAIPEFDERESYQVIVELNGEEKEFEIELDEFIVL
jgi:hypothetical protein